MLKHTERPLSALDAIYLHERHCEAQEAGIGRGGLHAGGPDQFVPEDLALAEQRLDGGEEHVGLGAQDEEDAAGVQSDTWLHQERRRGLARAPTLPVVRAVIQEILGDHFFVMTPGSVERMLKLREISCGSDTAVLQQISESPCNE